MHGDLVVDKLLPLAVYKRHGDQIFPAHVGERRFSEDMWQSFLCTTFPGYAATKFFHNE